MTGYTSKRASALKQFTVQQLSELLACLTESPSPGVRDMVEIELIQRELELREGVPNE
jgi:hypothetical protein